MEKPDKILTLHPQGKKGVNISREKYETIRAYILKTVKKHGKITYQQLNKMAIEELKDSFEGSVGWYLVSVKLDLEARNMIERIPGTSPHVVQLVKS